MISQGRLLKKKDKRLEKIEVNAYPWLDFSVESIVFTDNPRKSVIRSQFHDPRELEEKVKRPKEFSAQFAPRGEPLLPVDLTEDYRANLEEIALRKRRRLMDEDEIFSLELAEMSVPDHDIDDRWKRSDKRAGPVAQETPGRSREARPEASTSMPQVSSGASPSGTGHVGIHGGGSNGPTMDARDAFMDQGEHADEMGTQFKGTSAPSITLDVSESELEEIKNKAWEESYRQGFQKGHDAGFAQGEGESKAQGYEAGHREGFATGFQEGESRAEAAGESKTEAYFKVLGQTLGEIDKLRDEVLASGQEIFMELAKIACEKILRAQLSLDDAALARMYRAATESFQDRDRISVEMNPQDAARLRRALAEQGSAVKVAVRENAQLQPGDFKVEADSEVVTVDVRRALDVLLESLRESLFSAEEAAAAAGGASAQKKVG